MSDAWRGVPPVGVARGGAARGGVRVPPGVGDDDDMTDVELPGV